MITNQKTIYCLFSDHLSIDPLHDDFKKMNVPVNLTKTWLGFDVSSSRYAEARLAWNTEAFFVRFDAIQKEPLVINSTINTNRKAIGLWEKDVCEIFIAPNSNEPQKYFEFEVAPTGEWLDLAIHLTSEQRETDWEYQSNMKVSTKILEESIVLSIEIPWNAFGKMPKIGDIWLGNLFRCIGEGANRDYIAWQPTKTDVPNFHMPSAFGNIMFTK